MALDLYAGPLTRYMIGDWENVIARSFREQGRTYQIITPKGSDPEDSASPEEVAEHVVNWMRMLSEALASEMEVPLSWTDLPQGAYLTDRPHWVGYSALLIVAAHSEHSEFPLPTHATDNWSDHPSYKAAMTDGVSSSYTQILRPELWLPGHYNFAFDGPNPANREPMCIGSVQSLCSQLHLLNDNVLHASEVELAQILLDGPPQDGGFDGCARFGFAIFSKLAEYAKRECVPLKLDY